ncbi:MAG: M42 family peptidase [bacterium]
MDNTALALLQKLVALPTPSGWEADGMNLLARYVKPYAKQVSIDLHGNLRVCVNPQARVRVMIDGHCDEIGFMVQYIDEKGFLFLTALGGVTTQQLAGERIIIQGRKGPVNGVFGVTPPHLLKGEDVKKVAPHEITDIGVDIGASNQAEAEKLVELGSPAVIDAGWRPLAGDRVACRGFDDRIGAFVVMEAVRRLHGKRLQVALHAVASVQEELGLVGATTAAYDIQPHAGIAVDVGFASDCPKHDKKLVGDVALGKGPIVVCGPTYHPKMQALLFDTAKAKKIGVQRQVRARGNGTNAWPMRMSRSGAAVGLISIPLRYMHSPVEVLSLRDVEQSIDLLVATLLAIPAKADFQRPQP